MKIKSATLPVLIMAAVACPYQKARTQGCSSSVGANTAATFSTLSYSGSTFSWTSPGNAQTSDGNYASASKLLGLLTSQHSDYLTIQNFGFSIPSSATICEIHVEVERSASGLGILGSNVTDQSIVLLKNGSPYGNDLASGAAWPGSEATATYGNGLLAGTWGGSWLPSDINSPNFGVAISAKLNGVVGLLMSANIDQVRMTVIYDPHSVLSLGLEDFTAVRSPDGDGHILSWIAGGGAVDTRCIIQRSGDGHSWQDIATVPMTGGHTSSPSSSYTYTDHTPLDGVNFYRLHVVGMDGSSFWSIVKEVDRITTSLRCWPNPFVNVIHIPDQTGRRVVLKDMQGRTMYIKTDATGDWQIPTAGLPPGLYFLQVGAVTYKMLKQSN
ncbi:MAG: T9SS type A sorting domain-containing protein [Chitinophagaceae bacterium]|nr:T9SS type A sorting domain-containing protein [Chitinophagaceae bacterium]